MGREGEVKYVCVCVFVCHVLWKSVAVMNDLMTLWYKSGGGGTMKIILHLIKLMSLLITERFKEYIPLVKDSRSLFH